MERLEIEERKEMCADVLAATILTLADVFIAQGKSRKKAIVSAVATINACCMDIARSLI